MHPDEERREPDPVDSEAYVDPDESNTASAYAPPQRGPVWRSPFFIGVVLIVVLAVTLVVVAVLLAS